LFSFLDVPASAAYFGGYEILQRLMVPEGGDRSQISIGKTIFAGGMAGIFNWMIAIPPDVLKSRLQTGTSKTFCRCIFVLLYMGF
jgi:solute carrier family 25 carnitine/acylcarnitine transporter 20/29